MRVIMMCASLVMALYGGSAWACASATSLSRSDLATRLYNARELKLSFELARQFSDSIPEPVARQLSKWDSDVIGSDIGFLHLGCDSASLPSAFRDQGCQMIYVFSDFWSDLLYVSVAGLHNGSWRIVWDTTLQFGLPQPKMEAMSLGIEGDSSLVFGIVGLVSPRGQKGYVFLQWTGVCGTILATTSGSWLEERDVDEDGIDELIIGQEEPASSSESKSQVVSIRALKFDPINGNYRAMDEGAQQKKRE